MKREVITTNDGSSSLFVPELNETYHSIHGAVNEALHVFIKKGLDEKLEKQPSDQKIKILEVGFGTGLNALLTAQKALAEKLNLNYTGIEKYPIDADEIKAVNYGKNLNGQELFNQLHEAPWENTAIINPHFSLLKLQLDLVKDELPDQYDLVYFDAFAPNKQASMWSEEVFTKIFNVMNPGGRLVTYCCQGQVKRTMKAVGFEVAKTDGPPGKREMLTATKL